ncbi:hypothetical protein M514_17573 [Trichuris suis]|uniref:Uncharacterized protein n=1 Tax=Trichuris suis TaxID=68888 RepID=A0A085NL77_9BILA|nr:hypothetical protein M514_17573 [Trichuris suis]
MLPVHRFRCIRYRLHKNFSEAFCSCSTQKTGHEDNQAALNMFTDHLSREDDKEQDQHAEVVRENST